MKRNIAIAVWFLGMVIVALLLFGCSTSKPDFKPLPPEKLENLLFDESTRNIAYKSVTKKDYECEEEC